MKSNRSMRNVPWPAAMLAGLVGAAGVVACDPATPTEAPGTDPTPDTTAADDAPPVDPAGAESTPVGDEMPPGEADSAPPEGVPTAEAREDEREDEPEAESADGPTEVASNDEAKKAKKKKPGLPGPVHRSVDDSCGKGPALGAKVKPFKLETPGGKAISPGMFRGRVVLLNFWGTWCKPCLEELPEFDRLYRRYRKHGLSLVAVATDEDAEAVQAFLDKRKIAAKVAIGGEKTAAAYGAGQFPFTFVVDADGVIRGSYSGYKDKCMGKLEQDIREELEKIAAK